MKLKFSLCLIKYHAVKLYAMLNQAPCNECICESGGIVQCTLNPALSCFTPGGKIPQYPSDRRLDGPQIQSGCSAKEKESLPVLIRN